MSTQMKLKHEVDNMVIELFDDLSHYIDTDLYNKLCVETRNKISAQINFVDDRIAEQLK